MKTPDNVEGLWDDLDNIQSQMRIGIETLPPSQVKKVLNRLMEVAQPLVGKMRTAYPEAIDAFEKQIAHMDTQMEQARQNIAKAKENLANVPPAAEIRKNLVPLAAALPSGLSLQFADEMRDRYVPAIPDPTIDDGPGAAWQDWSIS
ncbi:hypothetical protein Poly24_36840 [Rosistilla carotiformis]|uniref:Uncharacterized protein n=1 Tax=Rosistilla carotiformis TaxID=2528017 RepID=A0A518JWQ8_9BACT|nr:hypothetical protein [Rosistilla carotiformis]QDV69965.1 hypothetical protein Poly24_36840 [Rosistilla carotiformis]